MIIENKVLEPQLLLVDFDNGVSTGLFDIKSGEILDYVVLESTCASDVATSLLRSLIENNIDIRAGFVHKDYDYDILEVIGELEVQDEEFLDSNDQEKIVKVWIKEFYNKDKSVIVKSEASELVLEDKESNQITAYGMKNLISFGDNNEK